MRTRNTRLACGVIIAVYLGLAGVGHAAMVTVEVTGVVGGVTTLDGFELDGSVQIGTEMTALFTYDSEAEDQYASEYSGLYDVISVSLSVGNYTFYNDLHAVEEPFFEVTTVDPTYEVKSPDSRFDETIYVDGTATTFDEIEFYWTRIRAMDVWTTLPGIIEDDSLPTLFPEDVSVFNMRRGMGVAFAEAGEGAEGYFGIGGEITSLQVIPEPGMISLFGLGALLLRRRKRPA